MDLAFYKEAVAYAKKHDIILLSDLAYSEIYFDDNAPPPSILQINGAKDVAVEFTSLSKTFSMPGWRMGFAVGNERLIGALTRIKSYLDYGAFTPIQVAASAALDSPEEVIRDIRNVYKERRDVLINVFSRAGWDVPSPQATMFAWARIPPLFEGMTSLDFPHCCCRKPISRCRRALDLVSMATIMCVLPWLKMNSAPVRQAETCERFMEEHSEKRKTA